jgi:hypothetical protein
MRFRIRQPGSTARRPRGPGQRGTLTVALWLVGLVAAGCGKAPPPAPNRTSRPVARPDTPSGDTAVVADQAEASAEPEAAAASPAEPPRSGWQPLFDGKSLDGWASTPFGGEGEVSVEDGQLVLGYGASMTGITYQRDPPRQNFEIELEAMRVEGNDFFCGLTFPVADAYCSLILGGWGGSVVGLSSIDGFDASENDTTNYLPLESGRWYQVRVRVTPARIEAWLDGKVIVDKVIEGHQVGTRPEVELSKPLGIATWETRAALRNIRLRQLPPAADTTSPAPPDEEP